MECQTPYEMPVSRRLFASKEEHMTRTIGASLALAVLLSVGVATVGSAQSPTSKPAVFVGPQMRDGFVEADRGVVDAVKDVQAELQRTKRFTIAKTPDAAMIVVRVLGRRDAGTSGSVGVPIGATALYLPIQRRAIDVVLQVGTYEKPMVGDSRDSDAWRAAARHLAEDIVVWVDANRALLTR